MEQFERALLFGGDYSFDDAGLFCKDCADPVPYRDLLRVTNLRGSGAFHFVFRSKKGKKRKISITLDRADQIGPLRELLPRYTPNARAGERRESVWEACSGWVTLAVCLEVLVGLILALNLWGQGVTVRVPVWFMPFLLIGRRLGTTALLAIGGGILAVCIVGTAVSLAKRKTVWEMVVS